MTPPSDGGSVSSGMLDLAFKGRNVAELGLAWSVDVDPQTGGATGNVSLPLPEGRAGFGPSLALRYASSRKGSPFGLGWSLSGVSSIAVSTRKHLPRYDGRETYVLDGDDELVPALEKSGADWIPRTTVHGGFLVRFYRSTRRGAAVRFEQWQDQATRRIHWRTRDARNVVTIFGLRTDDSSRIADPNDPRRTFLWLAEGTFDPHGNAVLFEYAPETADGIDLRLSFERARVGKISPQRYLKRVRYANTVPLAPDQPTPDTNQFCFEVVLDYGDHADDARVLPDRPWPVRPDAYSTFVPGFEVRTYRRCRRIHVFHRFAELGTDPLRVGTMTLDATDDPSGAALTAIRFTGRRREPDGSFSEKSIPPLTFTYGQPALDRTFTPAPQETLQNVPAGFSGRCRPIDLYGEGLFGILTENERAWYYKPNLGDGRFGPLEVVREKPAGRSGTFILGDFDRNGDTDFFNLAGRSAGFYEYKREEREWAPFRPFRALPHLEALGGRAQWIDLNGDGHPDIIVSLSDRFVWYPSEGKDAFGNAIEILKPDGFGAVPKLGEDLALDFFFADMTGDGLLDLVRLRNGRVEYWPQLGNGRFGSAVVMADAPQFAPTDEFDPARLRLVDLDGTGPTDILYIGRGEIRYWWNASGNRLVPGGTLSGLPYIDNVSTLRVLDFLGNGRPCLVWSSPLPDGVSMRYLPLQGEVQPRLLLSVDDSMGRAARLTYGSSARHYLRDKRSGRDWATRLPSHRQVVETRVLVDQVGGTSAMTTFAYHDGYFDGELQEFHGFGQVEQYDSAVRGTPSATASFGPPACTRTWFHLGEALWRPKRLTDAWSLDAEAPSLFPFEVDARAELDPGDMQDAMRALAGLPVRRETFAVQPGGALALHPFEVSQTRYRMRRVQPKSRDFDPCWSFHASEELSATYEQAADDPRVGHHLVLQLDDYDAVTLAADVAYARRDGKPRDAASQARTGVTLQRSSYVNVDAADRYALAIPTEWQTFELGGLLPTAGKLFTRADLTSVAVTAALTAPSPYYLALPGGTLAARLLQHERSYYWNDARSQALPLGAVGTVMLVHHEEAACFSRAGITDVFGARVDPAALPATLGYAERDGLFWQVDPTHAWGPSTEFSLLSAMARSDGGQTQYQYDTYRLALVGVVDAAGNASEAAIDYQLVAPSRIVDANRSVREVQYDALGVIVASSQQGQVVSETGASLPWGDDPLENRTPTPTPRAASDVVASPATYLQGSRSYAFYDLDAWSAGRGPVTVVGLAREELVHDGAGGGSTAASLQIVVAYLDGFGRTLQSKQGVEPGPAIQRDGSGRVVVDASGQPVLAPSDVRWLSSGHVVYDEKQQPGLVYEPFFTPSFAYEGDDILARFGVATKNAYDALGRKVREDRPDGTFERTEYFAWETRRSDANDTVNESAWAAARTAKPDTDPEKQALVEARVSAATPVSVYLDAAGRESGKRDRGASSADDIMTESILDVLGRTIGIVDPRGLRALDYRYNLQGRVLYARSVDAGEAWALNDGLGRAAHAWDARGFHQQRSFDRLDRLVALHVEGQGLNNRVEELVYGDDASVPDGAARNARGRLALQRDEAGTLTALAYDPEGRALRTERKLRTGYTTEPDWSATVDLDPEAFTSRTRFDALGRVRQQDLADGTTRQTEYLKGGGIARVRAWSADGKLAEVNVVQRAEFNARGDRTSLVLGNGVAIGQTYDAQSFRRTRSAAVLGSRTIQDYRYTYDPAGNITRIADVAQDPSNPGAILSGAKVGAVSDYRYDPHYRLTSATGRVHQALLEHDYMPGVPNTLKGTRHLSLNNGQAVETYARTFGYDPSGNLLSMRHVGASQSWTTTMWVSPTSNRSLAANDPNGTPITNGETRFDAAGNNVRLDHLRAIDWSWRGTLSRAVIIDRSATGQPDDGEYYVYGADMQRVRKVQERLVAGQLEVTEKIYLDGCELKRVRQGARVVLERWSSHVSDGENRVAIVHRWNSDDLARETDDVSRAKTHYQLANHQGSAVLELDEQGGVIAYEEMFPYGGAAFLAGDNVKDVSLHDYRYSGKECDDATSLYYYGYRYYASWIGRWLSPDPIGPEGSLNLYQFVLGNPTTNIDEEGLQPKKAPVMTHRNVVAPTLDVTKATGKGSVAIENPSTHEVVLFGTPEEASRYAQEKWHVTKIDMAHVVPNAAQQAHDEMERFVARLPTLGGGQPIAPGAATGTGEGGSGAKPPSSLNTDIAPQGKAPGAGGGVAAASGGPGTATGARGTGMGAGGGTGGGAGRAAQGSAGAGGGAGLAGTAPGAAPGSTGTGTGERGGGGGTKPAGSPTPQPPRKDAPAEIKPATLPQGSQDSSRRTTGDEGGTPSGTGTLTGGTDDLPTAKEGTPIPGGRGVSGDDPNGRPDGPRAGTSGGGRGDGRSIEPLPPVSPIDRSLEVPKGFAESNFDAALEGVGNSDNPWGLRLLFGLLALLTYPLAFVEHWITLPFVNTPFLVQNAGIKAGEYGAKATLHAGRGETAEAVEASLQAVASGAGGFLAGASVAAPAAGLRRGGAARNVSQTAAAEGWQAHLSQANKNRAASVARYGGNRSAIAKLINLPAWKKVTVDMPHIAERHMVGGRLTGGRNVFPVTMNQPSVMRAIRQAYASGVKVAVQGDRLLLAGQGSGLTIEMWFNTMTRTIETAYPK